MTAIEKVRGLGGATSHDARLEPGLLAWTATLPCFEFFGMGRTEEKASQDVLDKHEGRESESSAALATITVAHQNDADWYYL